MDLPVDLERENSCDLTIICGNQSFHVVRELLVTQSKVFERYCLPCVTCIEITPTRLPLSADHLATRCLNTQYIHAEIDAPTFGNVLRFLESDIEDLIDDNLFFLIKPKATQASEISAETAYQYLNIYLAAEDLEIAGLKVHAADAFAHHLTEAFSCQNLHDLVVNIATRVHDKIKPGSQVERTLVDLCSSNPVTLLAHPRLHELMKSKYSAAWDLIGDTNHFIYLRLKHIQGQALQANEKLQIQVEQFKKELGEIRSAKLQSEAQAAERLTRLEAEINTERQLSQQIEGELADEQAEKSRLQKALSDAEAAILAIKKREFDQLVEKGKEIAEGRAETTRLQGALSEAEGLVQTIKERELAFVHGKMNEIAFEKAEKARFQVRCSAAQDQIWSLDKEKSEIIRERDQKVRRLEHEINETHQRLVQAQTAIDGRRDIPSPTPSAGLDKQMWISQSSVLRGVLDQIDAAVHADDARPFRSDAAPSATFEHEVGDSRVGSVTPTESRTADIPRRQYWTTPPYSNVKSKAQQNSNLSASSGVTGASMTTKSRFSVTAKEFQPGIFGNATNRIRDGLHDSEQVADRNDGTHEERIRKRNSAVLIDI